MGKQACAVLRVGISSLLLSGASAAVAQQPLGPTVEDLIRVADIAGLAASPDGSGVAFRVERGDLASNSYPTLWYLADLATGKVRPIGSGGEAIYVDPGVSLPEMPVWAADSRSIFFRALVDGEVQIWRAGADASGARAVVRDDSDVVSIGGTLDGRSLTFTLGATRDQIRRAEAAEYQDGIFVDEHVDLAQNLHRGALINNRPATQRLTGNWFARAGLLWRQPLRHFQLDLESLAVTGPAPAGRVSPVPTAEGPADQVAAARSAVGDLASASWGNGFGRLSVRRQAGGASLHCAAEPCRRRAAWLAWRPGHDQLVFAVEDAALSHSLFLWDLGTDRVRPLVQANGFLNGGRDLTSPCAATRDALVCVAASAASPPRVERVDLASGARSILFDPNEDLRGRVSVGAEPLSWRDASGNLFTGTLFTPPGAGSGASPLFVTYYRCEGFLRGGLGDEWPLTPMAGAGISTLCINKAPIRGPQDALANNRAALDGIRMIVRQLGASGRIDPLRVGMGGLSFGSEATMWVAFNSDLLAAASISSPALEPSYYWFNGVRGRDTHEKLFQAWGLKAPEETPDRWKLLSAALNVDRVKAPLLMQMPEQEARLVSELHARLTHSATPSELHVFPDEPHFKVQPRHKLAAYRRNLDWFRYWLQGYSDPDPAKAEQYRRWDALAKRASEAQRGSKDRNQSSSVTRSKIRK